VGGGSGPTRSWGNGPDPEGGGYGPDPSTGAKFLDRGEFLDRREEGPVGWKKTIIMKHPNWKKM